MKHRFLPFVGFLLLCVFLTSCGSLDDNSQQTGSSEYHNVQTSQKEIGTPSQDDADWRFLNAFFYQDEPVQIGYVKSGTEDGLMDVYLYREDESSIYDICQMEDGTIVLLVQADDGTMKLAVLDAATGKLTEKSNIKLEDSTI